MGLHARAGALLLVGELGRVFPIVPGPARRAGRVGVRRAGVTARAHRGAQVWVIRWRRTSRYARTCSTRRLPASRRTNFTQARSPSSRSRSRLTRLTNATFVAGSWALIVAVSCREDVALVAAIMGASLAIRREHRTAGVAILLVGVVYFGVYMFGIAPRYVPRAGSLELHFGHLGGSPAQIARTVVLHPVQVLRVVAAPVKLLYGPRLLAPVAFLSLVAPRWLLPALVPFGINMLSQFPTAPEIQSHYAALAVPFVFASAAHGAGLVSGCRSPEDRQSVRGLR